MSNKAKRGRNFTNKWKPTTIHSTKQYKKKQQYKDTRGFWEYSTYQKKYKTTDEAKVKTNLCPSGFDPVKVNIMLHPRLSKEEKLLIQRNNNIKLRGGDRIILENWLEKKQKAIEIDMANLKRKGLNATVSTREGKIHKLMLTLDRHLTNGNQDIVAYIYLKLKEEDFKLDSSMMKKYLSTITKMNQIVKQVDIIKLQFIKYYGSMPPLNNKGFTKLDDFQVQVIHNIDSITSTIVKAPTSSGKSVITGYLYMQGNSSKSSTILVAVPTDPLAWQMAAFIGRITGTDIPIVTSTWKSSPKREELISRIVGARAVVGTPKTLVDYLGLPELSAIKFDWVVFDEIHMMGKDSGKEMELLAKRYNNVPFLALSATIGNVHQLKDWFESLGHQNVNVVECDKRFFNLQRFFFDSGSKKLVRIHPLSMVDIDSVEDGSLVNRSLQPTPPDIWDLAIKLQQEFDLDDLDPYTYFDSDERIELDKTNLYFSELVQFMIDAYQQDDESKQIIVDILKTYKHSNLDIYQYSLLDFAFCLKESDKCPAIFFQEDMNTCLRMVKTFASQVIRAEFTKYPNMKKERRRKNKHTKRIESKRDSLKIDSLGEKKRTKLMMGKMMGKKKGLVQPTLDDFDVEHVSIQQPHNDFIFNKQQYFSSGLVESWVKDLKQYFPNSGDEYHYIIDLLWRGVGVYVTGLPDPYLRLVQSLASKKQLAIVFSDTSLVFGVSMPFRTSCVLRADITEDTLDPMMFHQMAGRAGRRGLDKEGNSVFVGYSWDRIKELSASKIPNVEGTDTMVYGIDNAVKLSGDSQWSNLKTSFLSTDIEDDEAIQFYDSISQNLKGGWCFAINDDKNFNHMIWRLRENQDSFRVALIIPYLEKAFRQSNPNNEMEQINLARFMLSFLMVIEVDENDDYVIPPFKLFESAPYNQIKVRLSKLQLDVPDIVDGRLMRSIQMNKLLTLTTEPETHQLRDKLMQFSDMLMAIQHYFFHSQKIQITRLFGKLLTRIWWIYHMSSPIYKPL